MRKKAICELPAEIIETQNPAILRKSYSFETITPMFGGDAESWILDLENPVRSQSVKGQLRFWWRCMQNESDNKKLLYKENSLWGGTVDDKKNENSRIKSLVSISITDIEIKDGDIIKAQMKNKSSVDDSIIPGYVLYPITSDVKDDKKTIHFIKKIQFNLNISFPMDKKDEVIKTLTLWTLFGGVGARTRRGTGSLYCKELLDNFKTEKDIKALMMNDGNYGPLAYPRLAGAELYCEKAQKKEATKEWHAILSNYGIYRQDRTQGRPPGRSYWPEPDAIRRLTKQHAQQHEPEHPDGIWFPRAAFGLPIITRFNDKKSPGEPGGGKDIHLEPDIGAGERFPSPVILKVIQLVNGDILKCAIVLKQEFPKKLVLKEKGKKDLPVEGEMLPFGADLSKKTMRKNSELNGKTIYQDLAGYLGLEDVK